MVDLECHAKYLNDTSSSRKVAKTSLTYKETTVIRELISHDISNSDYKENIEALEKDFTHIVAEIQYGGTFTMVFERGLEEEEKRDTEELMSAILNDFPQNKFDLSVKEKYKIKLTQRILNLACTAT